MSYKLYSNFSNCIICFCLFVFQLIFISSSQATQSNSNPNMSQDNPAKIEQQDKPENKINNSKDNISRSSAKENSLAPDKTKESKSSDYSNLISAFVAAILTFLASQYNESKNWKRKKAEYLRDKQFTQIVASARILNNTAKLCNEIYNRIVSFEEKGGTELKGKSILYVELNSFIKTKIEILKKGEIDFDANMLELKLLKVDESNLNEIQYVRNSFLSIVSLLEESIAKNDRFSSELVKPVNKYIMDNTAIFVENALQAISG